MKEYYSIDPDFSNARLDKWIKKKICEVPQSLIEKNIRKGKIKVNGKKVKSSYKLKASDKVVFFDVKFFNYKVKKHKFSYRPTKKDLSFSSKIFVENNENFAVINKPAGISVQSGTKSKKNILDILKQTKEFKNASPYAVHRIDKETTGILIVAKNRKYAQLFTSLFRIRKIHKTYLCIALGVLNEQKGTFKDDLFYYEKKKKIKVRAITHFQVLSTNNIYSLIKLNPETGRKHQIRKQLLMRGCPVLGDSKYRIIDNYTDNSKLMLHAYKISFSISGEKYNFSADLPSHFNNLMNEKSLKIFL